MHADISRDSYRPNQYYSTLVAQQGRALLDADANEQADLQLGALRRFIADVIGPAAGPSADAAFGITFDGSSTVSISAGRYYVDGIEIQVGVPGGPDIDYFAQPFAYLDPATDPLPIPFGGGTGGNGSFSVHLRVFERLVTSAEDPAIREVALGDLAPDTAARRQTVWQILGGDVPSQGNRDNFMSARAVQPTTQDLCAVSPDSSYRGCENQLYRVEVHNSVQTNSDGSVNPATFKWSRENGSVVFPIESYDGNVSMTLAHLGRDDRLSLEIGDWVEIVDDAYAARLDDVAPSLRQVVQIDRVTRAVTLSPATSAGSPVRPIGTNQAWHPLLRRWDQRPAVGDPTLAGDSALSILPGDPTVATSWINLEDGVQVLFPTVPHSRASTSSTASNAGGAAHAALVTFPPGGYNGGDYRRGDYWLIPARTLTGDVEWPTVNSVPSAEPPNGPDIHYAPICQVNFGDGALGNTDHRQFFASISKPIG